ncbi:MAG TPA: hypothetical protein VM369_08630, partial [Candidatus Binatia bacterium]|nr:hypothetical protein [Candidatus Binatia bacterium]
AARLIDVSDPAKPFVVSKLKLEIHQPDNDTAFQADVAGNGSPFGYEAHYCGVDRQQDPTVAACGYFQSGIRVFDISNPYSPKEIAYYNPPAQVGKLDQLVGSEHAHGLVSTTGGAAPPNLTTDWCSSQIRVIRTPDGGGQLWGTCQDNGFMVLRFTNGVWPPE